MYVLMFLGPCIIEITALLVKCKKKKKKKKKKVFYLLIYMVSGSLKEEFRTCKEWEIRGTGNITFV